MSYKFYKHWRLIGHAKYGAMPRHVVRASSLGVI
jgi:hypothetical protein